MKPKVLVDRYIRVFTSSEGQDVMDDLREFSGAEAADGCALSHEEYAYRAGKRDMFKYIEALTNGAE